jgi:hypothetical protein
MTISPAITCSSTPIAKIVVEFCCFADDSTYTKSDEDPEVVQTVINEKYSKIADYMAKNRLVLNSDKTHLMHYGNGHQVSTPDS